MAKFHKLTIYFRKVVLFLKKSPPNILPDLWLLWFLFQTFCSADSITYRVCSPFSFWTVCRKLYHWPNNNWTTFVWSQSLQKTVIFKELWIKMFFSYSANHNFFKASAEDDPYYRKHNFWEDFWKYLKFKRYNMNRLRKKGIGVTCTFRFFCCFHKF